MTFWALAAAVCVSVYFLVLVCAQAVVLFCHQIGPAFFGNLRARANFLFAARMLPFVLALTASAGLALPAFLKFEPRITHEGFGARLWVFSMLGMAVVIVMLLRAVRMYSNTLRLEQRWLKNANASDISVQLGHFGIPVYQVSEASSLVAITGLVYPKIFVSKNVVELLQPGELSAALGHEAAHAGVCDNLKLWLLKITEFPAWLMPSGLGIAAWTTAAELAADDAALGSGVSALDLASALLKVARLKSDSSFGGPLAVCHLVPDRKASCLGLRLANLEASLQSPSGVPLQTQSRFSNLALILLPLVLYAICLSVLLPAIHEAIELLVS